jgi:hypothetical protein
VNDAVLIVSSFFVSYEQYENSACGFSDDFYSKHEVEPVIIHHVTRKSSISTTAPTVIDRRECLWNSELP